jgi:hypothetical protein
MQITIEEQRLIERGEVVRISSPEIPFECVVMRADACERMQSSMSASGPNAALLPKSAPGPTTRTAPAETRFKPASRRWNLLGMAAGTALGALPAVIPSPAGPLIAWTCLGTLVGFMIPFLKLHHWHEQTGQKTLWWISAGGALLGGLFGVAASIAGQPLKAEEGLAATCTCGLLAGFFIVDSYLKGVDARRREDERLWGHSRNQ